MEQTSVYENSAQKKCDSDTDDEMGIPDDLKIVNRCNRKYDNNFSVHNNDDVKSMESF